MHQFNSKIFAHRLKIEILETQQINFQYIRIYDTAVAISKAKLIDFKKLKLNENELMFEIWLI